MDFHTLPRRDLQTLCKKNKIPANMTNVAMADALQDLPMVEGLEAIIQEAQQYQSPKRAAAAAGSPEPPSRTCRRTSTRKQPNPTGSSLSRTRRAAATREGAEQKTEDRAEEGAAGMGIPNSPTTLNARGRRTRTVITTDGMEEEEAETEKKEERGKADPLPFEVTKTPATRATRGRRATTQIAKSSNGADDGAKKQEEGGVPAVPLTPAASTARRATIRRGTRAVPATEEASGARSTRYRTRRAAMEGEAELETAASRKNAMRKAKAADIGALAREVFVAGEDSGEDGAPPEPAAAEEVKMVVPVALAAGEGAATGEPCDVDPTVENCLDLPDAEVSDVVAVDQTVEKADPAGGALVEEKGSHGVDQTVEEKSDENVLFDPTVDNTVEDTINPTVEKSDGLIADQKLEVGEKPAVAADSDDPTVMISSEDDRQTVVAVEGNVDQTAVEGEIPEIVEVLSDPTYQTVQEGSGPVVAFPSQETREPVKEELYLDQTAEEEGILEMIAELSLDPTVTEEEEVTVVDSDDQMVEELLHDPVDVPSEEMLVAVEVEGHVDPTALEIEVPILDQTVEDGEEITASEGEAFEETPVVGLDVVDVFSDDALSPAGASPEIGSLDAGVPATSQVAEVVLAASEMLLPSAIETPAMDVHVLLQQTKEEEAAAAAKEEEAPGLLVSIDGPPAMRKDAVEEEEEEEEEEEAEKEEEAPAFVSIRYPPAEEEKAADFVQQTQPPPVADTLFFSVGDQDKENAAAVKACLSPGLAGRGALKQGKQQQMAVGEYDGITSMRKLKAAVKEKILQLQAMEEKKKQRAALAALDDNCCIMSPKQC